MKTSELTGPDLDLWVAKAEGYSIGKPFGKTHTDGATLYPFCAPTWKTLGAVMRMADGTWSENMPRFSTDWSVGGPIIDREKIELLYYGNMRTIGAQWEAQIGCDMHYIDQSPGDAMGGPTPLIAAMRCYVSSKFGEELTEAE